MPTPSSSSSMVAIDQRRRARCRGEFCDLVRALDPLADLLLPQPSSFPSPNNSGGSGKLRQDNGQIRSSRSRALRLLRPILTPTELVRLDESGRLKSFRVPRPVDPFAFFSSYRSGGCGVSLKEDVQTARGEHRAVLMEFNRAEEDSKRIGIEGGDDGDDGDRDGTKGGGRTAMSEEEWNAFSEAHWGGIALGDASEVTVGASDGHKEDVIGNDPEEVRVCGVCSEAYRLLGQARSLLLSLEDKEDKGKNDGIGSIDGGGSGLEDCADSNSLSDRNGDCNGAALIKAGGVRDRHKIEKLPNFTSSALEASSNENRRPTHARHDGHAASLGENTKSSARRHSSDASRTSESKVESRSPAKPSTTRRFGCRGAATAMGMPSPYESPSKRRPIRKTKIGPDGNAGGGTIAKFAAAQHSALMSPDDDKDNNVGANVDPDVVKKKGKILVADSDPFVRAEIRIYLEGEQYEVTEARGGEECREMLLGSGLGPKLEAEEAGENLKADTVGGNNGAETKGDEGKKEERQCDHDNFDAVLLDKNLRGVEGGAFGVTAWLRNRSLNESKKAKSDSGPRPRLFLSQIIVLTEDVSPSDLRSYAEAGMDGCLPKPLVSSERLLSTVREAVEASMRRKRRTSVSVMAATEETKKKQRQQLRLKDKKSSAVPWLKTTGRNAGRARTGGARGTAKQCVLPEGATSPSPSPTVHAAVPKRDDPNAFEGVFHYNERTSFPYMILDSGSGVGSGSRPKQFFNLVVCHDLFDTHERFRILLAPLAGRFPGIQILLWNYPGQAYSTFPDDDGVGDGSKGVGWRPATVLNNEFHADCLGGLLRHVHGSSGAKDCENGEKEEGDGGFNKTSNDDGGRGRFDPDRPYYLLGYGSGGTVASYFAHAVDRRRHSVENRTPLLASLSSGLLRGLVLINSLSFVDPHYASVLHDCRNVFECSPSSRPDLPVYFYSRFLFSSRYLAKTTAPVALNLYTAVHNPISLRGRVRLCLGALSHVDVRPLLPEISVPILAVHGTDAALVRPIHAKSYVDGRRACQSIHKALGGGSRTCVMLMKGGHELWQERRVDTVGLVEQLLTGYHERNEGPVPWRSSIDGTGADDEGEGREAEEDLARQIGREEEKKSFEDTFVDSILGRKSKEAESGQAKVVKGFENIERLASVARGPAPPDNATWDEYRDHLGIGDKKVLIDGSSGRSGLNSGTAKLKTKKGKTKATKAKKSIQESFAALVDPTNPSFERRDNEVYGTGKGSLVYPDPEEYPEVSEYMSWRLARNRKRLARLQFSARVIQCALRAFMARTMVQRLRKEASAGEIQRCYRGRMGRKVYLRKKKELWAALFVQRATRGLLGRAEAHRQRQRRESQIKLARRWRGVKARRIVRALIALRNRSAMMIQCLWRVAKARMVAVEKRRRRAASIQIQRIVRGRRGRMEAARERDKYLFSRSQSSGIELGRQMLAEHKLHATRLQSEINVLNTDRKESEARADKLLDEISRFEEGVKTLETEMHLLAKAERENAATLKGKLKHELREQKIRLDQEFSSMLAKIADRKDQLKALEKNLGKLGRARQQKDEELKALERKLVVLLEAQESQLAEIRRRQENRRNGMLAKDRLLSTTTREPLSASVDAHVVQDYSGGPSEHDKQQAAQLMESTETMMKFGFMSMSMTYFSSLNMVNAMKRVAVQDTVMAAAAHAESNRLPSKKVDNMIQKPDPVVSTSTSDVSPQVKNWSVDEVVRWLSTISLSQYDDAFREGAVDGSFLCELTDDDLRNTLGVEHKLHRKKILFNVDRLLSSKPLDDGRAHGGRASVGLIAEESLEPIYESAPEIPVREYVNDALEIGRQTSSLKSDPVLREPIVKPQTPPRKHPASPSPRRRVISPKPKALDMSKPKSSLEPTRKPVAPPPSLDELSTWVRNQKVDKLKDALSSVPNQRYDRSLTRVQFVDGIGTAYDNPYDRQFFHLNKADEHGNTLLHVAAQNGNMSIAKLLLQKGANPDHQNRQGQTPGHFAVAYQFFDFASWLFDADGAGANDMLENVFGLGPYDGLSGEDA